MSFDFYKNGILSYLPRILFMRTAEVSVESSQLATSVPDLQYCPPVLNACVKCECLCAQFSLLSNESRTCQYRWEGGFPANDIAGPAPERIAAWPGLGRPQRRTNMFSLQTRNNYYRIRHQTCEHRPTTEYTVFLHGTAWRCLALFHLCQIIFIYLFIKAKLLFVLLLISPFQFPLALIYN